MKPGVPCPSLMSLGLGSLCTFFRTWPYQGTKEINVTLEVTWCWLGGVVTCPNLKALGLCRMWWSCTENSLHRVCKHHVLDNPWVCPALLLSQCLMGESQVRFSSQTRPVKSGYLARKISYPRILELFADMCYLCLAG